MDKAIEEKFLKQFFSDENFQKKLSDCKSPEEAHQTVKGEGYEIDPGEFTSKMAELNDFLQKVKIQAGEGELSEEDLEMVAGGKDQEAIVVHAALAVQAAFAAAVVVTAAASAA